MCYLLFFFPPPSSIFMFLNTLQCHLDLTNLRKVGTKGIKELPPNALGFILTVDGMCCTTAPLDTFPKTHLNGIAEVKYCFCTDDTAQYYIWLGVVKNMLRVKRGATVRDFNCWSYNAVLFSY